MTFNSVVVVGAPRSGTNMLRDMLVLLPNVGTWPCDEINYIWRHGNVRFPSDEFNLEMANPSVKRYIYSQFEKLAVKDNLETVVEKTCANSLRVGFVNEVIPDARYVFIVRDGVDVVGSAMKRWTAELDIPYLFKKVRYVPIVDLPYYAFHYFLNRLHRLMSSEKQLAFWGPQLSGMDALLQGHSLLQVCALQWQACVRNAERDLEAIGADRVVRVRYEDFVADPATEFSRIATFLGQDVPPEVLDKIKTCISSSSVNRGRRQLSDVQKAEFMPLIEETLNDYGYGK